MNAVDTNILFYAQDPKDPTKQRIARETIDSITNGVLIWQVACEFLWASRKLEKFGYDRQKAFDNLRRFRSIWKPILPTWATFDHAEILMNRYHISSWDALIVAACLENAVIKLYTEDIADDYRKEGIEVINPFQISR